MTTFTKYRGKISGPNHLMDLIGRELIESPNEFEIATIRLDDERRFVDMLYLDSASQDSAATNEPLEKGYGILICFIPDDLGSDVAVDWERKLAEYQVQNLFVLDRIIVNPNYWRSAICGNLMCCPTTGRPRPRLNEAQELFNELITSSESQGYVPKSMFTAFENIRIRDGFLVHLSAPEQSYRLQKWNQILQQTEVQNEPELEAIRQTLLSIIAYLKEELNNAKTHISEALQLHENYSLGKLVNRALESEAPASLIRDAFQAVTFEKLDLEPPK